MSLNVKKIKTKHLDIDGTQKDFDAIADVVKQAAAKINIDISPHDLDIPGRILIRKKADSHATHQQYPKLQKALKDFAEGLTESGDGVVDFGKVNITEKPEDIIRLSPTLRRMNQNSLGKNLGFGDFFNEDIIADMESMLSSKHQLARQNPILSTKPAWVYVADLVEKPGDAPLGLFANDAKILEKIKEYPPDLGGTKSWANKKDAYNQAYFVVLRVDKTYPPEMKLSTLPGAWDRWIKSRPVPDMMSLYKGNPPRNFGDLLERFAVYSTARTFGMRDAFLAPVHAWNDVDRRVGSSDVTKSDKILISEPIKSKAGKENQSEYATYMSFVVVGKGSKHTIDLGKEPTAGATELPGWD